MPAVKGFLKVDDEFVILNLDLDAEIINGSLVAHFTTPIRS